MKTLNTTDFHTDTDEVHHAELANLAAMARLIFHQVGATEVAQPELTTLVNFNGTIGAEPADGLITDARGDLFGTTVVGGAYGDGTVFEIAKTATGYASTPTILVNFNGANGNNPSGSLIADGHGDLFGTTGAGGTYGDGTVFEIAKTATGYASTPTILVSFNGAAPLNLIADSHGDLFGTTFVGGAYGGGTVFEIAKTATGYASTPTTLASFNASLGFPAGRLIADDHGDLFGTTEGGLVFEIPKTATGYATLTTLVNLNDFNSTYGSQTVGGLITDAHGDLFGTTRFGGANNAGTVFEIVKTANGYASTPTILVSFNGTNGAEPYGSLIADARGDLFGTTHSGGAYGDGTVFEIARTATGYASTPTILVSFNGANGSFPFSNLIADRHGDLFGTTFGGGANGDFGTVFEITDSGFSTHKTPSCTVVEAHDQFVFDPNLGENPTVNSNVHDETIDHFKSEFAQFAELQTQSHQDAVNPAFDAVDPMHDAATLAAQHAHHFLV